MEAKLSLSKRSKTVCLFKVTVKVMIKEIRPYLNKFLLEDANIHLKAAEAICNSTFPRMHTEERVGGIALL